MPFFINLASYLHSVHLLLYNGVGHEKYNGKADEEKNFTWKTTKLNPQVCGADGQSNYFFVGVCMCKLKRA